MKRQFFKVKSVGTFSKMRRERRIEELRTEDTPEKHSPYFHSLEEDEYLKRLERGAKQSRTSKPTPTKDLMISEASTFYLPRPRRRYKDVETPKDKRRMKLGQLLTEPPVDTQVPEN